MNKHISNIWGAIEEIAENYVIDYNETWLWREGGGRAISFYDEVDEYLLKAKNDKEVIDYIIEKTEVVDDASYYCGVVSVAWIEEEGRIEHYNFVYDERVD